MPDEESRLDRAHDDGAAAAYGEQALSEHEFGAGPDVRHPRRADRRSAGISLANPEQLLKTELASLQNGLLGSSAGDQMDQLSAELGISVPGDLENLLGSQLAIGINTLPDSTRAPTIRSSGAHSTACRARRSRPVSSTCRP